MLIDPVKESHPQIDGILPTKPQLIPRYSCLCEYFSTSLQYFKILSRIHFTGYSKNSQLAELWIPDGLVHFLMIWHVTLVGWLDVSLMFCSLVSFCRCAWILEHPLHWWLMTAAFYYYDCQVDDLGTRIILEGKKLFNKLEYFFQVYKKNSTHVHLYWFLMKSFSLPTSPTIKFHNISADGHWATGSYLDFERLWVNTQFQWLGIKPKATVHFSIENMQGSQRYHFHRWDVKLRSILFCLMGWKS